MEKAGLDPRLLGERLRWEQQDYWLHLEAKSPFEKYPAKQHAQRVAEKLKATEGLIYLQGEPMRLKEDSDMPQPFYQRRYFYYLSGCNESDCHLAYDIKEDSLKLFIPSTDPSRVFWTGRGSTPAEALDKYDIDEVFLNQDLERFIKKWATYHKGSLYILHENQGPAKVTAGPRVDFTSLRPAMDAARVVKDAYEIALIRKANDISSKAHREVLANILNFKNEAQVEGIFVDVCISENAKEQAYAPIAASGSNAATLHYDSNDESLEGRQLMCLDAGCAWQCYASDITRTFPLSGTWSKEAKAIYDLVERMQEACVNRLAPGVRYLDLHILAHQIAIDGLLSLGILHNGTKEEIYKAGTSRAFFPHGLGHHVGLEVHDVGHKELMSADVPSSYSNAFSIYPQNFHLPVYDAKMCRSPVDPASPHLEEGMVVTVEPGIYFSTYALETFYLPSPVHSKYINRKILARYMAVGGVRIEDDILVTAKGHENLTTAPKGDAMLEIIQGHNAEFSNFPRWSPYHRTSAHEQTLRRAPGIANNAPEPILKPLSGTSGVGNKAETKERSRRESGDFEPFNGPSLFSSFNPVATRVPDHSHRQHASRGPRAQRHEPQKPVCGDDSSKYCHAYMDFSTPRGKVDVSPMHRHTPSQKPPCGKCAVLVQTLERLRHNFLDSNTESESSQPRQARKPQPPTNSESPRNPFRQSTAPVPQSIPRHSEPPLSYRQSLPNLRHSPMTAPTSKPIFVPGNFTAEPESHKMHSRRPAVPHWSPHPTATNTSTPEMKMSSISYQHVRPNLPTVTPLSQTLDQVEEELITAVKKLRVLGEQAEGQARKERAKTSRRHLDVLGPATVQPKNSSYRTPVIDDMEKVHSRSNFTSEKTQKRRETREPSGWDRAGQ